MIGAGPTKKNEFETDFNESVVGALSEVRELPATGPALSGMENMATPGGSEDLHAIGTARKFSGSIDGTIGKLMRCCHQTAGKGRE